MKATKNRRRKSNFISKLRKKDDERYYGSGTSLPREGSIFDSDSKFNQAIKKK